MRILMVTDFYRPHVGGVEVVVRNLALELAARGHEVGIATIRTAGLPEREEDGPVRIHRLRGTSSRVDGLFSQRRPWAPPVPDPEAATGLRRVIARERPQIVHGHDWLARSFLALKPRHGPRFVHSLHYYTISCAKKSLMYRGAPCTGPGLVKCLDCCSRHYGRLKGPPIVLGNFTFAAAERRAVDYFLPVSAAVAAGNGLSAIGVPYEVIPNFVTDAARLTPGPRRLLEQLPKGDFLLFVGDLRAEKGVDVLFEAYRALPEVPPLVLIGKVWPDSPRDVPPNCRLLTDWPNDAVREAQRRCLALVAPSVWPEPFGMVVIEALAAGRPVIASRIGGIPELVTDGVNGLLVPPGDAARLGAAIQTVVADSNLRTRLSQNARESAAAFRADVIVPRFEAVYRSVLDRVGGH